MRITIYFSSGIIKRYENILGIKKKDMLTIEYNIGSILKSENYYFNEIKTIVIHEV